jgi:hypothetical protein
MLLNRAQASLKGDLHRGSCSRPNLALGVCPGGSFLMPRHVQLGLLRILRTPSFSSPKGGRQRKDFTTATLGKDCEAAPLREEGLSRFYLGGLLQVGSFKTANEPSRSFLTNIRANSLHPLFISECPRKLSLTAASRPHSLASETPSS